MGEFFKGWRRKAGCMSLVISLVLMMAWVRSYSFLDAIIVQDAGFWFLSGIGGIDWTWRLKTEDPGDAVEWWVTPVALARSENRMPEHPPVPYWMIVIPLTALSAFLLLSKPRKSTSNPYTEPAIAEGA